MTAIGSLTTAARAGADPLRTPRNVANSPAAPSGRALVVTAPAPTGNRPFARGERPSAAFLAHLIATAQNAPQTRERRRAMPAEAVAGYATAAGRADALFSCRR